MHDICHAYMFKKKTTKVYWVIHIAMIRVFRERIEKEIQQNLVSDNSMGKNAWLMPEVSNWFEIIYR